MSLNPERTVFCLGETVLDIIFSGGKPVSANPGGSLLNASVSMARAGISVRLISEIFSDKPGKMILEFLEENNVLTKEIILYNDGATPVALAFLDDSAAAEYSFYKSYPEKRLSKKLPVPGKNDIVLFGSIYSITDSIREPILQFLKNAREKNALIIYDPNFRSSISGDLHHLHPMILENISYADIVRGSDEDFLHIFATEDPDKVYKEIRECGCNHLVYTRGGKDVMVITKDQRLNFPVPAIHPVSTIGAGDSFNAGMICGLMKGNLERGDLFKLNVTQWNTLITFGILFSQDVCNHYENYISPDFAGSLK